MAFTQTDVESLERAYIRLNTGEQEAEIEFTDGRRVRYFQPKEIANALVLARSDVANSDTNLRRRPKGYRINVSKGV